MSAQETNETQTPNVVTKNRAGWIGGIVLIAIGVFLFLNQVLKVDLGIYFPLALGVVFLVWGAATRRIGLLIPGGIVAGIGVGALLVEGIGPNYAEPASGGLFLLAFAGGWGLITLASALFTPHVAWWPLIPGGILAVIGAALLAGSTGLKFLEYLGMGWPVILIILGVYLLFKRLPAQK